MIGPSYDADQQLLDEHTGRTIYRRHTDGTVIWHSNIVSADTSCPYGDASVPSQVRRQNMYNDMYKMMKKDGEQFRAQFNYALPNEVPRETAIACAENIAMSLSERFHRPVDYSIHNKPGNLHVHISMPEWRWENGHWGSKDRNYYPSKTGERLYAGDRYTDDNGNDLRIPKMETVALPDGTKIEQQATDKKTGRRLWVRKKERFLTPVDCSWIHDQIDHCINFQLFRMQSIDRVRRPDRKTREQLKAAGLVAKHVGPVSYRNRDERYDRITENNNRVRRFEKLLIDNKKMKTEAENEISVSDTDANALDKKIVRQGKKINAVTNEINALEKNRSSVVSYVEDILQPANVFANEAADRYENYSSMKKGMARPLLQSLEVGLSSTQEEMAKIKNAAPATRRRTARMNFLSRNANMMTDLHNGLHYITELDFTEKIRQRAKEKWRGLSGWRKLNYVQKRFGTISATIYQEYLGLSGNCPDSEKFIPIPLAIPDTQKLQNRIQNVADEWKQSMLSDDHMPPTNVSVLSELLSLEGTVTGTSFDTASVLSADYNPLESKREYEHTIQQIERDEQAEAARKAAEEAARIEQERIAKEQAEAARKAEAERQERERIEREHREVEQRRRQEEQRRKEEAERLAEQKRIEEQRRAEEEKAASVTVATTQGAATSSQTGIEHRSTKRDYYELSDRVAIQKARLMVQMARRAIACGTKHFQTIPEGIQYYEIHSQKFTEDAPKYGIDLSQLSDMQSEMKQIWVIVKDEEYKRPAMINQPPENLISLEQLPVEEEHLRGILKKAATEKSDCIARLLPKSTNDYLKYENERRAEYNETHPWHPGDPILLPLQDYEAEAELEKLYLQNTKLFLHSARECGINTDRFLELTDEADRLTSVLNESYVFHHQERKRLQAQARLRGQKRSQTQTKTQTQAKTKKKTVKRKTAEQQNTVQPELNE